MSSAKPFEISKGLIVDAFKLVKANRGAHGVDEQSVEDFERSLKKNLYKVWNRMSSGTYFPQAVREVKIPKSDGGERSLGVPTVTDRVAQAVVKKYLEPKIDPLFHKDSYGYRPNKSAHQAVQVCKDRCWESDWVVDMDIKGFFDNIDHKLLMHAVKKHTDCKWVLLYIERWLQAPVQTTEGELIHRTKGIPQGGVISPLLANLFMHHSFDMWMLERFPDRKFERYADDVVIHCKSLKQAQFVRDHIKRRLAKCKLELNLKKTKLVFCADARRDKYAAKQEIYNTPDDTKFDFLGFTFKRRTARNSEGALFDGFLPGMSDSARKQIQRTISSWKIGTKSDKSLQDISNMFNPQLRGWINYYGKFYPKALKPINHQMNFVLTKWAKRKFKRFTKHRNVAGRWVRGLAKKEPNLFATWKMFHEVKTVE